jgi:hypothetical protein
MFADFAELGHVELTLYTDALVARGTIRTRQHRVSDILNLADAPFLVLEGVQVADLHGNSVGIDADVAQINLDAVLFAVVDEPITPSPELRAPKMQHMAIISIPPFRVTGTLHLPAASANLREALGDLTGRFLPVTDAAYEAPSLGLPSRGVLMLAVNHHRAQILARYSAPGDRPAEGAAAEDPWAPTVQNPGPAWGTSATEGSAAADPWAGTDWEGGPSERPDGSGG